MSEARDWAEMCPQYSLLLPAPNEADAEYESGGAGYCNNLAFALDADTSEAPLAW